MKIKVGTRGSKLAVTQTKQAVAFIQNKFPELEVELVEITTKGDRLAHHSLASIGGQGAFVKEIEYQLSQGNIDLAIHSLKDLPTIIPNDLTIGAVLKRENPLDCLLFKEEKMTLKKLPLGAKVGTSSLRRQAQLLKVRPDLEIIPIRGNIDTRIKKLYEGPYDAIVLACAGLTRMGFLEQETQLNYEVLPATTCLPSIGQGALALECRKEDASLLSILTEIEDKKTRAEVDAERSFLRMMDGSCTFPIGAYAEQLETGEVRLAGVITSYNGTEYLHETVTDKNPILAGQLLANLLKEQGAERVIQECQEHVRKTTLHETTTLSKED